ncbi:AsmA family protein [bacterium]|nr:MAG: AsmA family protein [bacterium]
MRIFRIIFFSFGVVFLLILILSLASFIIIKHLRIKDIVENEIERNLGINVSIRSIEYSPLLAHVKVNGISAHNPPGFVDSELAYIESLHFVFDPIEIITRKKPNIYLVTLDLKRLNIIKNKEGKVNIKEIIPVKEGDTSKDKETPFYFDVLVLSVGEVRYIDYTAKTKKVHRYPINISNATFVGLQNENEVVKTIIYKALQNTDVGKLINLTIVPVVSHIGDTIDAAWGTAKTGAKGIWEIANLPFNLLFGKY